MPSKAVNYDADQHVENRSKGVIKVGGRAFHPRKKSGKLMKDLIGVGPDVEPDEDAKVTKEESQGNIDLVYRQLTMLLVDDEGEAPAEEFLLEELDFEDAQELQEQLMPARKELEAAKNAQRG